MAMWSFSDAGIEACGRERNDRASWLKQLANYIQIETVGILYQLTYVYIGRMTKLLMKIKYHSNFLRNTSTLLRK
jgi:hypothetical protein